MSCGGIPRKGGMQGLRGADGPIRQLSRLALDSVSFSLSLSRIISCSVANMELSSSHYSLLIWILTRRIAREIIDRELDAQGHTIHYLVRWVDWSDAHQDWLPPESVQGSQCDDLVSAHHHHHHYHHHHHQTQDIFIVRGQWRSW
jgi:UDP-2,3-diacylglucosamine pyrophosphatase LpxH